VALLQHVGRVRCVRHGWRRVSGFDWLWLSYFFLLISMNDLSYFQLLSILPDDPP